MHGPPPRALSGKRKHLAISFQQLPVSFWEEVSKMLPVLRNGRELANVMSPINRLDTFFDRAFGDDGFTSQGWSWAPVSIWEDDDAIFIEAEVPGVKDSEVELTVHNGLLYIRGQRAPVEGRRYFYNGRTFGRFERVVTLPEAVKTDDVEATLADGVLCVRLPKSPEAKPKKITLKTS
jgi:HSP20 family protein